MIYSSDGDPATEYAARLESRRELRDKLEQRHKMLGGVSIGLAVGFVALIALGLGQRSGIIFWALIPAAGIVVSQTALTRVMRRLKNSGRAEAFYGRALGRIENRWMGEGESGEQYLDSSHPYARDLDIFGKGSLFELLCTPRTKAGEETLARWLLAPASVEEISRRQAAVDDLRGRTDLREDLAVLGESDLRSRVRPNALAAWAEAPSLLKPGLARAAAFVLAAAWIFNLVAWFAWGWWQAALFSTVVNLLFGMRYKEQLRRIAPIVGVLAAADEKRATGPTVESLAPDLEVLAQVLARMERERFSAPKLVELQAALKVEGVPPSRAFARLARLLEYFEQRRSTIVAALDRFVFWSLQVAFGIEAWRRKFGPSIRPWLAAVGELEALCAIAGYAYEHPGDVFPEFVVPQQGLFEARGLAHPIIPEAKAVRNDLALGGELRLAIISGANMTGKSTLVRAVGVNAVLAQCGAPVRAMRLRLSPLAVAASICVLDSLQGGVSRFYSEITRLKLMTEMTAGSLPVLFLLDELLSGTNSHDRRIGAEGLVTSLVERGAIGMITTHDLALAQITERLGARAANFHIADHLEDGQLRFDYKLMPGVAQTSNALALMRSIGLEV